MKYSRLSGLGSLAPMNSPFPQDGPLRDIPYRSGQKQFLHFVYDGARFQYGPAFNARGEAVLRPMPEQMADVDPSSPTADEEWQVMADNFDAKYAQYVDHPELVNGYVNDGVASLARQNRLVNPNPTARAPARVAPSQSIPSSQYAPSVSSASPLAPSTSVTAFAMPGASTPSNGIDYSKLVSSYGSGLFSALFPSAAGSPGNSLIQNLTGESPEPGGGSIPGSPGALYASSGMSSAAKLGIAGAIAALFFLGKKRRR